MAVEMLCNLIMGCGANCNNLLQKGMILLSTPLKHQVGTHSTNMAGPYLLKSLLMQKVLL
jgi:hypothetical protein